MPLKYGMRLVLTLLLLVLLQAPVFSGGFLSKRTEIDLGDNAAAEFEKEHPPINNPELQGMVKPHSSGRYSRVRV